jgi:hypothetical protein
MEGRRRTVLIGLDPETLTGRILVQSSTPHHLNSRIRGESRADLESLRRIRAQIAPLPGAPMHPSGLQIQPWDADGESTGLGETLPRV